MKTNRNSTIIVLLCLVIGCAKQPIEPGKTEPTAEFKVYSDDYFPLAIGYWWKYQTAAVL